MNNSLINQNLKTIQEKLSTLRENKARNEATIEGINNRKKDLLYSVKNELNIENESELFFLRFNRFWRKNFIISVTQEEKVGKNKKTERST